MFSCLSIRFGRTQNGFPDVAVCDFIVPSFHYPLPHSPPTAKGGRHPEIQSIMNADPKGTDTGWGGGLCMLPFMAVVYSLCDCHNCFYIPTCYLATSSHHTRTRPDGDEPAPARRAKRRKLRCDSSAGFGLLFQPLFQLLHKYKFPTLQVQVSTLQIQVSTYEYKFQHYNIYVGVLSENMF